MKRLIFSFLFCCILIISVFLLFGNVEQWIEVHVGSARSKTAFTLLSFSLLTADIILPVPSSVIMILNGKMLGLLPGTLVSFTAGLLSSSIGFYMGRKTTRYLDRFFSAKDKVISDQLFNTFGNTAIAISKALPVLSEAVSIISGTTSIAFKTFFMYSAAGHFVVSVIYAYAGSFSSSLNSSLIAAITIIAALVAGWIIQLIVTRKAAATI